VLAGSSRKGNWLLILATYFLSEMIGSEEYLPIAIVAESDDETRGLIRSLLEFLGFAVIEARNGEEAYEFALCYRPDLIMIELQLPLVSGFGAIRRIKKANDLSHVPIIAISSTNPTNNNNLAMAAGCSAHVQKPIEFDRLESLIETLVACDRLSVVSLLVH